MTISIQDQIAEVEREIRMRLKVYPRRVADRQMTQAAADKHTANILAVLETLREIEQKGRLI